MNHLMFLTAHKVSNLCIGHLYKDHMTIWTRLYKKDMFGSRDRGIQMSVNGLLFVFKRKSREDIRNRTWKLYWLSNSHTKKQLITREKLCWSVIPDVIFYRYWASSLWLIINRWLWVKAFYCMAGCCCSSAAWFIVWFGYNATELVSNHFTCVHTCTLNEYWSVGALFSPSPWIPIYLDV